MSTDKKQLKEAIRQEFKKCAEDPAHFLRRYCYIQHPQKGKIKFDLYDYQEKTLKEFVTSDYNVLLKARQLGISTLTAGYALWMMTFFDDKNRPVYRDPRSDNPNQSNKYGDNIQAYDYRYMSAQGPNFVDAPSGLDILSQNENIVFATVLLFICTESFFLFLSQMSCLKYQDKMLSG